MPTASVSSTRTTMNRKPVLVRDNARKVLTLPSDEFHEKLLCDGIVLNLGDACAFDCSFCYAESVIWKLDKRVINAHNNAQGLTGEDRLGFSDVVIRRRNAIGLLKAKLLKKDGSPRYKDDTDHRVVYSSTLVDVAANMELLRETAEACNLILQHTNWHIRLLSKSSLLNLLVKNKMIPTEYHHRMIFGFSTGTLNQDVAQAIEAGTARLEKRLDSLYWLQDEGYRTFGMVCPSLPQVDYDSFSSEVSDMIRPDRCEHVWAEVINLRGTSLTRTITALQGAGFNDDAERLAGVSGAENLASWEEYARATFNAHVKSMPPGKLRFLQYVTPETADWWSDQRGKGAILLGAAAKEKGLIAIAPPSKMRVTRSRALVLAPQVLSKEDLAYMEEREQVVSEGVRSSIQASKALYEIFSYREGILWQVAYKTFEAYCRSRWQYGKSHSYRLKDSGEFIHELEVEHLSIQSPIGDWMPQNESHIRPILQLDKSQRVACWKEIMTESPPGKLTGAIVAKKAREHAKIQGVDVVPRTKPSAKDAAITAMVRLTLAVESLPQAEKIGLLIQKIEALIG